MNDIASPGRRAFVAGTLAVFACGARAQGNYPARAVTIVVPFPPGGGTDNLARLLAQQVSQRLGQPVVVDNRPGGNNLIATDYAARQRPDGYTLLLVTSNFVINPLLQKGNSDPIRDFTPVAHVADIPYVLVAHPRLAATSVKELVALLKQKPGQLTFASWGPGSSGHLAGELFKRVTGTDMLHVPYSGTAPALNDLVGGQVDLCVATVGAASKLAAAGKLRILGVMTERRIGALPDVPAIAEVVPGYSAVGWNGIVAPHGTPASAVKSLNDAMNAALRVPEFATRLREEGYETIYDSPEQFGALLLGEQKKWGDLISRIDRKAL